MSCVWGIQRQQCVAEDRQLGKAATCSPVRWTGDSDLTEISSCNGMSSLIMSQSNDKMAAMGKMSVAGVSGRIVWVKSERF